MRLGWLLVLGALACGQTFETDGQGGGASSSRSSAGGSGAAPTSSSGGSSCGSGSVAELSDDFAGQGFAAWWEPWQEEGTAVWQDDELVIGIETLTQPRYAGVSSVAAYALTSCGVNVELRHAPSAPGTLAFLKLERDAANFVWTRVSVLATSTVYFGFREGGTDAPEVAVPYDGSDFRYWRISEKDGELRWETSPDGRDWTARHSQPVPFDVGAVRVTLGAGSESTITTATEARFDNVNRLP